MRNKVRFNKVKSDYVYSTHSMSGRNVIIIIDQNLGNMSVTNDIDNVIREIAIVEKINPSSYMYVYQDSDGFWDGYDFKNSQFIPLRGSNANTAVKKYIELQLTKNIR
jgi:hypothetical protein